MRPNTGGQRSMQGRLFNRCVTVTPRRSSLIDQRCRYHFKRRTGASGIVCSIKVGLCHESTNFETLSVSRMAIAALNLTNYYIVYIYIHRRGTCWLLER